MLKATLSSKLWSMTGNSALAPVIRRFPPALAATPCYAKCLEGVIKRNCRDYDDTEWGPVMRRSIIAFILIIIGAVLISACNQEPTVRVIVRGAPVKGSFGINVDKNDRLYVASFREIVVMDPDSGKILERIGPDRGVEGGDDLAFGPDGSLYWTVPPTGEVCRLSLDGGKETIARDLRGANPITFSDDGRLYVALRDPIAKGLYELDPYGVKPPRPVNKDLAALNAFDFGPDGKLYAPHYFDGKIVSIDVNSGSTRTVAEGFKLLPAVKFDSKGRLFAVDQTQGKVFLVNTQTGHKTDYATIEPGISNLVFDSKGRLFVCSDTGAVYEVHANGAVRTVSPGGITNVAGIAVVPRNDGVSVYVPTIFLGIVEFDGSTGRRLGFANEFDRSSPLEMPMTLAPDGRRLIISSLFANSVQIWDPATNTVSVEYGDVASPTNAIRFQGDIVVAEMGAKPPRVVRISAADPQARTTLAEMQIPVGLAATQEDLWASDWAAGTVIQIVKKGRLLTPPTIVASNLKGPEGIAIEVNGSLLIVESLAARLSRVKPQSGAVSSVAENLELGSPQLMGIPFGTFDGVAVGPSGAIYVGGDKANVLYRIQ
jgi:sugar lactone lactonase YvrE